MTPFAEEQFQEIVSLLHKLSRPKKKLGWDKRQTLTYRGHSCMQLGVADPQVDISCRDQSPILSDFCKSPLDTPTKFPSSTMGCIPQHDAKLKTL